MSWRTFSRISSPPSGRRLPDDPAHVVIPGVHRVASLLKRVIIGTYHGGIGREHLDYDLDELTFRFNRRTARSHILRFYQRLEGAVQAGHTTTQALFAGRQDTDA